MEDKELLNGGTAEEKKTQPPTPENHQREYRPFGW